MCFFQRFEMLCREKRETTTSLGTQLGFSKGTISKWRHGECLPNSQSLQRLADYFSVSADYLLGITDIRNASVSLEEEQKAKALLFGTTELPEKAWREVLQYVVRTKRKYHLDS